MRIARIAHPNGVIAVPEDAVSTDGPDLHWAALNSMRVLWCVVGRMVFMARIMATATRWVDDAFPGWVEVELAEADGSVASLVEKVPVFTDLGRLTPETAYPVPVAMDCDVLGHERDERDQDVVIITLHHGIVDQQGRSTFCVPASQLR